MKRTISLLIAAIISVLMSFGALTAFAEEAAPLQAVPAAPSLSASAVTSTSVSLKWAAVENAEGYKLYQYNANTKSYESIKSVAATVTESKVKSLKSATEYTFKVSAYNSAGESVLSNSVARLTLPAKAVISSVKTAKQKATVKIKKQTPADGFTVYMATSKNGKYKKLGDTAKNKYTVKKLKNKKKKYYFKVRAYKTYNGKKIYGDYSSVKSEYVYRYVKTDAAGSVMSEAKFASEKLRGVKKNKYVKLIKKSGHWYKVEYKGETGFVYNRVIKNKSNISRAKVNKDNYTVFLDDLIFERGNSIKTCFDYVKYNMTYSKSSNYRQLNNVDKVEANEDSLASNAIKRKRGNCLSYASLLKTLLERAGHKSYYSYAHSTKYSDNAHCWCVVETENGYRHLDAKRGFYLLTDSQMKKDYRSKDLKSIEGHYPACK